MCTAISFLTKNHYFGRNLDLEYSYYETVTITPRNYPLPFRHQKTIYKHFAMIGMAYIQDNYPLYYEATNEKGLSMACLNFPGNADYKPYANAKDNITPFEFIPWVLSQCSNVTDTKILLKRVNLINEHYSNQLPLSPLHWMISDRNSSLTVESVKNGLRIYENTAGVLTNNPTFDKQLSRLNHSTHLSNQEPENHLSQEPDLSEYSRGLGALGIPGDWSSQSRFIKATFVKMNSVCESTESSSISQFFHILDSVAHPRGCVKIAENLYEITNYSCCCNTDKGIYYYKTYDNNQITAIDMHRENLNSNTIFSYPLIKTQQVLYMN